MISSHWNRVELAWLAGLLEGEGAFMVIPKRYQGRGIRSRGSYPSFRVSLNMTDGDVVYHAASVAGMGNVIGPFMRGNPKHSPMFRWNVNKRRHIYALLVAIYPYMGQRRGAKIMDILRTFNSSGRAGWSHGTRQGYEVGCRCRPCKDKHAERFRLRRQRILARNARTWEMVEEKPDPA